MRYWLKERKYAHKMLLIGISKKQHSKTKREIFRLQSKLLFLLCLNKQHFNGKNFIVIIKNK